MQLVVEPMLQPWRGPLILLSLKGKTRTTPVAKSINPKLAHGGYPIHGNPPRLIVDTVSAHKDIQVNLDPLRLTQPHKNKNLGEARGVQLVESNPKCLEHFEQKRNHRKLQPHKKKTTRTPQPSHQVASAPSRTYTSHKCPNIPQ